MSKPFYDHIPRYKTVFFPGIQVINRDCVEEKWSFGQKVPVFGNT